MIRFFSSILMGTFLWFAWNSADQHHPNDGIRWLVGAVVLGLIWTACWLSQVVQEEVTPIPQSRS